MKRNTITDTVRFCKDIGMFAIDRPRKSCRWRTAFCAKTCFNIKLEGAFGHYITPKDAKNEEAWQSMTKSDCEALARKFKRARNQTRRARLMTRGEAFETLADVERVEMLLDATPETTWWIPTRAWRGPLWGEIERRIGGRSNVRLMKSTDPETDHVPGWAVGTGLSFFGDADGSTMYYGDDDATEGRFKCPKAHRHQVGHCATCRGGCFSTKAVHVHLKQH